MPDYSSDTSDTEREHEFLRDVDEWLPEVNREYNSIKSEDELIRFVDSKNDDKAAELLKKGIQENKCYRHRKALNLLTASIKMAEVDSPIIPVACGYRATILLSFGYFEDAYIEAGRSLVMIDPSSSFYVHILSLMEAARLFMKRQEQEKRKKRYKKKKKNKQKLKPLPCASDCVRIASDARYGRHLVATREIQPGEIISIEKPYIGSVNQGTHSYCSECLIYCKNPIPCLECTQVQYCSLKCSELAWRKYHKYECKIKFALEKLPEHNGSTVKAVLSLHDYFDEPDQSEDNIYRSDRYKEFLRLCNNKDKMEPAIRKSYAEYAAKFFDMVHSQTDFFDDIRHIRKHDMFKVLAFKIHCILAMNSLAISSPVIDEDDKTSYRQATYPFTSLYNFTCVPNVSLAFHKNKMEARAIYKIKEGEQLFRALVSLYNLPIPDSIGLLHRRFCYECNCFFCGAETRDHIVVVLPRKELADLMTKIFESFNRHWNIPGMGRRLFDRITRITIDHPDFHIYCPESRYYEFIFNELHRGMDYFKDPEGEFHLRTVD